MTDAEQQLWHHLRRKQLGVQFYRQRPIGPYIVDFYAPAAKLVIEVDGGQHAQAPVQVADANRDAWLRQQGLNVLRYDNRQALTSTNDVLEQIQSTIYRSYEHANPTPRARPFSGAGIERISTA